MQACNDYCVGIDSKIILIFNLFSQNKTDDDYRLGVFDKYCHTLV